MKPDKSGPSISGRIARLAFSRDGKYLACSVEIPRDADHGPFFLKVWDCSSWMEVYSCKHPGLLTEILFSPNGKQLVASALDGSILVWETGIWEQSAKLESKKGVWAESITYSPNGDSLAVAYCDGMLRLWDTATYKELFATESACVERGLAGVVFAPRAVITVGELCPIQMFDPKNGKELARWDSHLNPSLGIRSAEQILLSRDGKRIATFGPDGHIRFWDLVSRKEISSINVGVARLKGLAVSPDDSVIAAAPTGGLIPNHSGAVILYDVQTGKKLSVIKNEQREFSCMTFSPDGRFLVTGTLSENGRIQFHDLKNLYVSMK